MAKKNSTKTATKEALQNSEPRLQAFRQWKGINFSEVSPLWNRYVEEVFTEDRQTDLPPNFLLVQNNLKTTAQASIETTFAPIKWATLDDVPDNTVIPQYFTGISVVDHDYGYFVFDAWQGPDTPPHGTAILKAHHDTVDTDTAVPYNLMEIETANTYIKPNVIVGDSTKHNYRFTDLHVYLDRFIAMAEYTETITSGGVSVDVPHGTIFVSDADNNHEFISPIYSGYLLKPQTDQDTGSTDPNKPGLYSPDITPEGELVGSTDPDDPAFIPEGGSDPLWSSQCTFYYCMTNEFGATQPSTWNNGYGFTTMYFDIGPSQWTTNNYITIRGKLSSDNISAARIGTTTYYRPVGVDIYMIMNESTYPVFIGHADADMDYTHYTPGVPATNTFGTWTYKFYGAMTDLSEWNAGNLEVPQDNTTDGVHARYVNEIDGRLYYWGDPEFPYRLYVGGNAGHELSIALGLGGAYIDIEPGSGCEIKMVEKFKTYGGSSIVTVLCSNVNGTRQHRYNLIETNITTTSELSVAGYMVEEIANVVGTTSRWGGGAWSDGLYYVNRNGLLVTTQQMEYSSQLRSVLVSDPISPVFEEQKGTEIANSHVVCIKDIIYMATCHDSDDYANIDPNVDHYNSFIWCYDIGLKAWYTMQVTVPRREFSAVNSWPENITIEDDKMWNLAVKVNAPSYSCSSDKITVLPETTYKIKVEGTAGCIYEIEYFNGAAHYMSKEEINIPDQRTATFTTPAQCSYITINFHNLADAANPQLYQEIQVKRTLIPNGLFVYDHEDSVYYGLGVIDPLEGVYISPMLSNQENSKNTGDFERTQLWEFHTGELGTSNPNTQWQWLCQLEFNMDYFWGKMEIEINGVDYYGRRMHIVKKVESPLDERGNYVMLTAFNVPIRIDTLVRYYHIIIKGEGMVRLNNIVARTYTQSKKVGIPYGFDAEHYYMDRFNSEKKRYMHDAVSCYNNLNKLAYEYRVQILNPDHDPQEPDETIPILDKETSTVT